MIALDDDPHLLDTEFVDCLVSSDHLTKEQKKEYWLVLDAANRLALQPSRRLLST